MNRQQMQVLEAAKPYLPLMVYSILSILILFPLLKPGYIFTLDSTQIFANPTSRFFGLSQGVMTTSPGILVDFLNFLFSRIFPPWIFEKLLLLVVFFLAGLGAHRLTGSKGIGSYFAGVLYTINPFTYIRFMAGQWGVLFAYAIIPFAIKAFLEAWDKGGFKAAAKLVLLATLTGLLDIHGFFLLILVVIVLSVVRLSTDRNERLRLRKTFITMATGIGLFLLLNLYWIVPVLTSKSTLISQIGQSDLMFFAPRSSSTFGVVFDVASLWGFWRTGYLSQGSVTPFWWLFFSAILFLVIYGCLFQKSRERWFTRSFGITGIIALFLAVGAASSVTYTIFIWLWQNMPYFNGFRDSQKFVVILCISYAVLGGLGIDQLILNWGGWRKRKISTVIFSVFAFVIALAYGFPVFNFQEQLKTTNYPQEWYEVNNFLKKDKQDFNVLFFPWHEYMDFNWLPDRDQRLANPADQFFEKPIISGDNMESGGIYSQSTNPISKYMEFLLNKSSGINNLGELLAPLNVKYVILVNEVDYQLYDFLYHQKDLKIVLEKQGITLFENEHSTACSYAVDSIMHIQSMDDYLTLSKTQDVMQHIYNLESSQDTGNPEPFTPVNTVEKSPVQYTNSAVKPQYTIFTVAQNVSSANWEYNGRKPILFNLGLMPVFESSAGNGNFVYTRFYHIFLPCFIISALTLVAIITVWVKIVHKKQA